jgi:hypothetical protein
MLELLGVPLAAPVPLEVAESFRVVCEELVPEPLDVPLVVEPRPDDPEPDGPPLLLGPLVLGMLMGVLGVLEGAIDWAATMQASTAIARHAPAAIASNRRLLMTRPSATGQTLTVVINISVAANSPHHHFHSNYGQAARTNATNF